MLAYVSLTTPILLGGLFLLSLPVIAHLMHRHSRRTVVFPSIELLMMSVASQSRLSKLRRWLLLFLRLAAVALIVLAFVRPVWLDASQLAGDDPEAAAAVVLLVDVSLSSSQEAGGVALLERIRGAASRTVDSLRSGTDVANIVLADAVPQAVFPRLTANLPAVRSEVASIEDSYERADLATAFSLAGKQLSEHDGPQRLVIFSDLQATNWSEVESSDALRDLLPSGTIVSFAELDIEPADNIGLGRVHHFPAQPLAGQPCDVSARISNFTEQMKQVPVTAELVGPEGGLESLSQTITLEPGEQRDITFAVTTPQDGALEVVLSIPDDGLAADNTAYVVVESSARLSLVVLSDDDPDTPGTAAYYMLRALTPHGSELDRYAVRHVRSGEISESALTGVSAVFVGYLAELSPTAAGLLVEYVAEGGGVVMFCGDGPVQQNLEALQTAAGDETILPWRPGARRLRQRTEEPLRITSGRWQSRWFREFDEQSQLAIAQIQFQRIWSAGAQDPSAEVLLSFSDNTPALGSRLFGQGQFLLAGFTPDATASDLGKHGSFVAWMQILARSLRPDATISQLHTPGTPYEFPELLPGDAVTADFAVVGPDGNTVPSRTTVNPDGVSVALLEPKSPGIYHARSAGQSLGAVSINIDPRESDLRRMDSTRLSERMVAQGINSEMQQAAGWDPILNLEGRPLWGSMFAAALCMIGLEMFLLGLWRR